MTGRWQGTHSIYQQALVPDGTLSASLTVAGPQLQGGDISSSLIALPSPVRPVSISPLPCLSLLSKCLWAPSPCPYAIAPPPSSSHLSPISEPFSLPFPSFLPILSLSSLSACTLPVSPSSLSHFRALRLPHSQAAPVSVCLSFPLAFSLLPSLGTGLGRQQLGCEKRSEWQQH